MTGFLGAILLILGVSNAVSAVRITNDRGGHIGSYVTKYQRLASAGESVIIDGLCASACTILLSELPHDKICVTSRAMLGFHAAWNFGPNGRTFTDPEATLMLYSTYPTPVRRWIALRFRYSAPAAKRSSSSSSIAEAGYFPRPRAIAGMSGSSAVPSTKLCEARICSTKVDPARGIPTMKIGSGAGLPPGPPRTSKVKSWMLRSTSSLKCPATNG